MAADLLMERPVLDLNVHAELFVPRVPVVKSDPYESAELLRLKETGPVLVEREPNEIEVMEKEKPLLGVTVNSK